MGVCGRGVGPGFHEGGVGWRGVGGWVVGVVLFCFGFCEGRLVTVLGIGEMEAGRYTFLDREGLEIAFVASGGGRGGSAGAA